VANQNSEWHYSHVLDEDLERGEGVGDDNNQSETNVKWDSDDDYDNVVVDEENEDDWSRPYGWSSTRIWIDESVKVDRLNYKRINITSQQKNRCCHLANL